MKINCDYCGATIDTNKYKVCPYCGAAYNEDNELIDFKNKQKEQREIELEKQRIENKKKEKRIESKIKQEKFLRTGKVVENIIKLIILIPCLLITFGFFLRFVPEEITDKLFQNNKEEDVLIENLQKPIVVGFNELATIDDYNIIVTELTIPKETRRNPEKGYMFIALNVTFQNTGEYTYHDENDFICTVNDILCETYPLAEIKYFKDGNVPSGTKVAGYLCYEVPIDATEFVLTYGDYITIKIPNTLQ